MKVIIIMNDRPQVMQHPHPAQQLPPWQGQPQG